MVELHAGYCRLESLEAQEVQVDSSDRGPRPLRRPRRRILAIGLEHVIPKLSNWALALAEQEIETVFFSRDIFGHTRRMRSSMPVRIVLTPNVGGKPGELLLGFPLFFVLLLTCRPDHVEVYDPELFGRFWRTCTNLARAFGFPLVVLNRGGLAGFSELPPGQKEWVADLYNRSSLIIVKELYMSQSLRDEVRLTDSDKIVLVHNGVHVGPEPSLERTEKIVLFLNHFIRRRRLDLCIQAASLVCEKVSDARFWFVGDRPNLALAGRDYRDSVWGYYGADELYALAESCGVKDKIQLFPFTEYPDEYYRRASVFLLPADTNLVYCNFSLLEAMERGIPPVVSDVTGSELIVDDGVTGYRVKQTPSAIAERLVDLLSDESRRKSLGAAARAKILKSFSVRETAQALERAYQERVWQAES